MVGAQQVGTWAFILGVVIAIVAGCVAGWIGIATITAAWIMLVLVILGLIIGFLNIGDKDITPFLIAVIALLVVGAARLEIIDLIVPTLGTILNAIISNIVAFVAPAAIVVGLKAVWNLSRSP